MSSSLFEYVYLCLLDESCDTTGHSVHCKERNEIRRQVMLMKERENRRALMDADIAAVHK